jgi:hypothetical protein
MRRAVLAVCALFAVAVVAGSLSLMLAEDKNEIHHIHGEVTSLDAAAKTFTVKEKLSNGQTRDVTFTAEEKMKVTILGKPGKLEDVKAGDSIHVRYRNKGKLHEAGEIAIVAPPAKKS